VKIVDFGIAKLRESGAHTQTGTVLGTPAYMSFEQASGMRSDELDARSDVYSLGVVVYEMLTGRAPFHSDTPVGYLRMHMQEDPPPFRAVKPDLPPLRQVESVVMKALTKDRDQRYGSAVDFAGAFMAAAQPSVRAEAPLPLPSTRIVSPPAMAKPPQLRTVPEPPGKMKFVAIAVVALSLIVSGVWYFSPSANPQVVKPRGGFETSQMGAGQQPPPVETPAGVTVRENPKDGLKYVWIPPGTFMMGCSPGDSECGSEEKPPHQVNITKGFWMGQTEVTVGAYKRFAAATGRQMPDEPVLEGRPLNAGWGNEAMPIVDVAWDDAQAYCSWAGGRLPTEAEWEYAARAGSTGARYGDLHEIAWYADNSGRKRLDSDRIWKEDPENYNKRLDENGNGMHEVGQKRANGFGLYDMLGNVWEWVNDWYDQNYYQNSPFQDPTGPTRGTLRVLRGGSWDRAPRVVRVSVRYWIIPVKRIIFYFGLRCGGEVTGN
jgi:formylglycine-generating enzyme required for sulfatase activity